MRTKEHHYDIKQFQNQHIEQQSRSKGDRLGISDIQNPKQFGQDHAKKCSASDSKKTAQNTDPENATPENSQTVHADKQLNAEIFRSRLVQSIREATANIEKITFFEWEDMETQDYEDVF
jgi:hypothetical protein